ncbi:MAG TPA: hypothetical protein VGV07_21925 [Devosia sp.]|jgi:hypothetical protein|uniref:hypothetical protein n=1 Tax=Devosia sp. TaxID=1871048 RepID=UPI002DDD915B|nr:hypothetical protein [Devosia sp.]HEV2517926.1 hypothetical protein [Devosia sp.]
MNGRIVLMLVLVVAYLAAPWVLILYLAGQGLVPLAAVGFIWITGLVALITNDRANAWFKGE